MSIADKAGQRPAPPIAVSYDRVARALHWLIAGLAVIVVSLGSAIPEASRNTQSRDLLLLMHRSVGLTILVAMVVRWLWRLRHPPPPLQPGFPRPLAWFAGANHWCLYLAFLLMPIAGYVNAAAAGHSVSFFGLVTVPSLLPEDERLSQIAIALHLVGQFFVYAFVAAHVAAALMHRFIRRDEILDRMLPARPAKRN